MAQNSILTITYSDGNTETYTYATRERAEQYALANLRFDEAKSKVWGDIPWVVSTMVDGRPFPADTARTALVSRGLIPPTVVDEL